LSGYFETEAEKSMMLLGHLLNTEREETIRSSTALFEKDS
jgi:hypothetical protein